MLNSRQVSFLLFLLFFLFFAGSCACQSGDSLHYSITQFTDENGLPQNSVKSIVKDKDGFIWLSTEAGLVRYDGQRFLTFNSSVVPVRSNRMGSFYPVNSNGNGFFALSDLYDYLEVKRGNVFLMKSGFENFLTGMPFSSGYYDHRSVIGQSMPNLDKATITTDTCIVPDASGGFFVCTPKTVSYYKGLAKQYEVDFAATDIWSFFRLGDLLLWMDSKGIFKNIQRDSIHTLLLAGDIMTDPAYHPGTKNFEICWNNATGKAFIYLKKRLYSLEAGASGKLETQLVLSGFDFEANSIITAYYDEISQMIFLGSSNKGLFTFSPQQFRTANVGGADKDNVYYGLWPWGNDQVITTQGNVLGLTKTSVIPEMKKQAKHDKYSMLIDRNGYIWTKYGNYINKFDKEGKNLVTRWDLKEEVTQIYEGNEGQIWIGSTKIGLFMIDPSEPHSVPRIFSTQPGLANITCMRQTGPDTLWIGTASGLYRLHLKKGNVDSVKGLEQFYIRSLYIPTPEEVWITTYGAGFFLYKGNILTKFPLDKNKYLLTTHCILEDKNGFFWITTNKGLFQAAREDLLNYARGRQREVFYLYYEKSNGFLTNEFNGGCEPCGVKLKNGYFSFPSLNGLVWFKPGSLRPELPDKEIFVNKAEINREEIVLADTLHIARNARQVKFYITTSYFGNPYNLNIEYTLVKSKQDSVWLALGADKTITLSSLSYGSYHLVIRKCNGFGKNNYTYKVLILVVSPHFYETEWFRILLVLVIAALVWMYIALRMRAIRRRNRVLEERIVSRTRELEQTLTALKESESGLRKHNRIQEQLIAAIAHDIKSPLKYMVEAAKRMFGTLHRPGQEKEQELAGMLVESGTRVYYYSESLLQYIRSQTQHQYIVMQAIDIYNLVQEKVNIFQSIAGEQHSEIINQVPPQLVMNTNGSLLGVIIHNLIDNAVKVTLNGRVTISATSEKSHIVLSIEDTGAGMRPELINWCNNENVPEQEDQTGMGLLIVKELVTLLNARLQAVHGIGRGTVMQIVFGMKESSKD